MVACCRPELGAMAALQLWARERAGDFAFDIMCEVARDYDVPNPRIVDALPCDERDCCAHAKRSLVSNICSMLDGGPDRPALTPSA